MPADSKRFWHKRAFYFSVDVFDVGVSVAINMTAEEARNWLRAEVFPSLKDQVPDLTEWRADPRQRGRTEQFAGGFVVLLTAEKGDFLTFLGVLVHEMTHVSQFLLRDRAVPLTLETEEVYAYLVQHLVRSALAELGTN